MQRQRLVRLQPSAWKSLLVGRIELATEPLVLEWARQGWPLIVRRAMAHETVGLPLGLPLPPSAGKRRIAVRVAPADVASVGPLPSIDEVFGGAPRTWQPCLRALAGLAGRYGVRSGVFGSLAWQRLTGLEYLTANSDLDMAWELPVAQRLDSFLEALEEVAAGSAMRVDGEVIRHDGVGVNWRELRSGATMVALKMNNGVRLCARSAFIAGET